MFEILHAVPYNYIIDGTIGGLLYVLVQKYGWDDRAETIRRLIIGAIGGYVVFISGLPNSFTALGLGYVGIDAIEAILTKTIQKEKIQEK